MAYVPRVELNSGHTIPVIGLGTFHHIPKIMRGAVIKALHLGYRHFDCAFLYRTEEEVGDALQVALNSKEIQRSDLFITSKLPMNGLRRDRVEYFLRKSLSKLKLQYVDLYLIHAPFGVKGAHDDDFWPVEDGRLVIDTQLDLLDVWEGMEEMVRKGLARSIGLSNFNSQQVQRICNNCKIKPAMLQIECHPYLQQSDLLRFCKERQIVLTGFGTLGSPPTATNANPPLPLVLEDPYLLELSAKYEKSTAQIIIRWALQRGIVVIPNTADFQQLSENIDVFDFTISDEEMKSIGDLNRDLRIFPFNTITGTTSHPEYPFNISF